MRTFAQVDENSLVRNIAVFADGNVPADLGWPDWRETGDGPKQRASIGGSFVAVVDGYPDGLFYDPSPHDGWILDESYDWQPPADKPYPDNFGEEDSGWHWDEVVQEWIDRNAHPG